MSAQPDQTARAGRGFLAIIGAKLYFILTSYAVQLLLPRLLEGPAAFGDYSAAMNLISIVNNVLIVATVQSVSKLVSEEPNRAASTLRQGLGLQALVGLSLGGTLLLSAPWVAGSVLLDPSLTPLLRVGATVVCSYALYAALVGFLNGQQLFQKQARLDATFSTLRSGAIIAAAAAGFGALGAISGFALAAVCILGVAAWTIGVGGAGPRWPARRWLTLMAPLWLYQTFLNGVLQIDLPVLKRTAAELAMSEGLSAAASAQIASQYAGYYRAAQTFAFVPYQLILSLTFVLFPLVSRTSSAGDHAQTRRTVRHGLRLSLLTLVAIAAPIAGASEGVMRLAYPDAYLAGAPALQILVAAMVAFALFVVCATLLSGAGKPAWAATAAGVGFVTVVVSTRTLIGAAGLGEQTLTATAIGTTIGTTTALAVAGTLVYRLFGAFMPAASMVRVVLAASVAFATARFIPHEEPGGALLSLAGGFAAMLATLWLSRELTASDVTAILKSVRRK